MRILHASSGEGKMLVEAAAVCCGKDINLCIGGGDTFHIGASSLAIPRPSLKKNNEISASASVICVTNHKKIKSPVTQLCDLLHDLMCG